MFSDQYNFFEGKASYVDDPQKTAWEAVRHAHAMLDSVLALEKGLTDQFGHEKYNYETKGKQTVRVYSVSFSRRYHQALGDMVERQMRASIKMTGDLWYTAWVDAGQPDLNRLINYRPTEEELKMRAEEIKKWREENFNERDHHN